ncbi:MAG: BON domain-containing protein [Pseudobdellovibrio sp.]
MSSHQNIPAPALTVLLVTALLWGLNILAVEEVTHDTETNRELSSQDQGTSEMDIEITQKIRQQITKQNRLSLSAKNINVITKNGIVVLKGPVPTINEKKRIESIAVRVVGKDNVTDEIAISR